MTPWTDERRAELRERWSRQETATAIAAALGGVTRNQVIAEAHAIMPLRERDLAHDADPVRFGSAIVKCEGYAPECVAAGKCMADGQCFASSPELVAARMVESLIPPDPHARGVHRAYLRKVAQMLRAGQIVI